MRERIWGAVYVVRSILGNLAPDASIVLTSGLLSQRPSAPGNAVLSAAVGAVEALARGLAIELQPVRVNAVAPGPTDSPLFSSVSLETRQAVFERTVSRSLVKRMGSVEEMASAIVFLMTNTYINGQILHVDGGAQIN